MKKLPTGIQTFSEIREDNYAYVDKTEDIYRLVENGKYYFLSRPRRFGKSLLIDTISELFMGSIEYFKGLYIYDKWDWETKYPVINISWGSGDYSSSKSLKNEINLMMRGICRDLKMDFSEYISFKFLIRDIYEKYNQKVVILVDEYDKPIIDVITNKAVARENRDILGSFYSAIKASDRYIKFAMLTGVSKFSKVNLFSNLNNLTDITIDAEYGTITGYTQRDLETVFAEHLEGADMDKIKRWYNGYNYFAGAIYNPFDILQFIAKKNVFENYWWETGNPSFLIEMLKKSTFYMPDLENLVVGKETLNSFDVDRIELVALLWQTGYLTFDREIVKNEQRAYKMKVPNIEVQRSLNTLFFDYLTYNLLGKKSKELEIADILVNIKLDDFELHLRSLFSSIPYNNYVNNVMANYEGYYSSVIYSFLASLGFDIIGEDVTNKGRIDLSIKTKNAVYILEYKVDSKEDPIKQIKERKYYEKYQTENKAIYIIGIKFDSELRNISDFKWEKI